MITDQPSDITAQPTARTASASLAAFLDENPLFESEPIDWNIRPTGTVDACAYYLSPESSRLVSEVAQVLHAQVTEITVDSVAHGKVRRFEANAVFDGVRWTVRGYLPLVTEDDESGSAVAA